MECILKIDTLAINSNIQVTSLLVTQLLKRKFDLFSCQKLVVSSYLKLKFEWLNFDVSTLTAIFLFLKSCIMSSGYLIHHHFIDDVIIEYTKFNMLIT